MFQLLKFIDLVIIAPIILGLAVIKVFKLLRITREQYIKGYYGLFIFTCIHTLMILVILLMLNIG